MIKFSGNLSRSSERVIWRVNAKVARCGTLIVMIPFAVIDILLAVSFTYLLLLFLVPFTMMVLFAGLKPKGKLRDSFLPKEIVIDGTSLVVTCADDSEEEREMDEVKAVMDLGDCYRIVFYMPHKSLRFICQKDLIQIGTLDAFEALFSDKIIRKEKRKHEK